MKETFEDVTGGISDHTLENTHIEADPQFYSTRFLNKSKNDIKKILLNGSQLSIVIDTERYRIGIGSDHHNMYSDMGINSKNYFAGFAKIDRTTNKIMVTDLTDCRTNKDSPVAPGLKKAIAERLQQDILN